MKPEEYPVVYAFWLTYDSAASARDGRWFYFLSEGAAKRAHAEYVRKGACVREVRTLGIFEDHLWPEARV